MPIVKFPIKDQEYLVCIRLKVRGVCRNSGDGKRTVIDQRCDDLCLGPFHFCIELLRKLVPTTLVCHGNLWKVVVQNGLVEMDDELKAEYGQRWHDTKDARDRTRLTGSGTCASAACCATCCCTARRVDSSILGWAAMIRIHEMVRVRAELVASVPSS